MNDELLMKKQVNACLNYHCEEYTIACFSRHCEARSNLAHCAFNNIYESYELVSSSDANMQLVPTVHRKLLLLNF